jgi:hypothetical protein
MEISQSVSPPTSAIPDVAAMILEVVSLIGFVAVAGPPVLFIAAPWILLALLLAGPFAVLLALVLALAAAAVLVGCIAAMLATPYLMFRRRRAARRLPGPVDVSRVAVELPQLVA